MFGDASFPNNKSTHKNNLEGEQKMSVEDDTFRSEPSFKSINLQNHEVFWKDEI